MYATPQVPGTSPLVAVSDLAASLAFYIDALGFTHEVGNAHYGYALVRRGPIMIGLINAADEAALKATANNVSAQLWVEDLDALWADIAPNVTDLPEDRVRAPFTQPYGTREFHLKDPDGFLMLFTQLQISPDTQTGDAE